MIKKGGKERLCCRSQREVTIHTTDGILLHYEWLFFLALPCVKGCGFLGVHQECFGACTVCFSTFLLPGPGLLPSSAVSGRSQELADPALRNPVLKGPTWGWAGVVCEMKMDI